MHTRTQILHHVLDGQCEAAERGGRRAAVLDVGASFGCVRACVRACVCVCVCVANNKTRPTQTASELFTDAYQASVVCACVCVCNYSMRVWVA